jgi:4a-hydroxytetrahydrobiopterin dehydratase
MSAFSDAEIERRLQGAGEWRRAQDAAAIERELALADFAAAIAFVDRVAEVAEAANHHPDILVHGWNKVRLTLSTHSQGGLTDADFALAREIDRLGA